MGCGILAGGKSSRMGKEKALLPFRESTFLDTICTVLEDTGLFDEKIISSSGNFIPMKAGWIPVRDCFQGKGPIGGMHAVLKESKMEAVFFTSCDMPFLEKNFVANLCGEWKENLEGVAVITKEGRKHPLCGIYRTSLLPKIEDAILAEDYRLLNVLDSCKIKWLSLSRQEEIFVTNINTPKEYREIKQ